VISVCSVCRHSTDSSDEACNVVEEVYPAEKREGFAKVLEIGEHSIVNDLSVAMVLEEWRLHSQATKEDLTAKPQDFN